MVEDQLAPAQRAVPATARGIHSWPAFFDVFAPEMKIFAVKLCLLGDFQPVSVLVNSNLFGTIIHLGFHFGSTPGSASW